MGQPESLIEPSAPTFHEKTPGEGRKMKLWREREKKKERSTGGPTEGGPRNDGPHETPLQETVKQVPTQHTHHIHTHDVTFIKNQFHQKPFSSDCLAPELKKSVFV